MAVSYRADTLADLLRDRGLLALALAAEHLAADLIDIANGRHGRLP